MARIRVALITTSFEYGGSERLLVDIAKGLDRDAFDVKACAITAGGKLLEEELARAGIEYRVLDKGLGPSLRVLPRVWSVLRQWRPQIVHTFQFTGNTYGRIGAILARAPVVIGTKHGPERDGPFHRLTYRVLARFTDRMVVVTKEIGDEVHAEHHMPRDRIELIEEGIDLDRFAWVEREPRPAETSPAKDVFRAGVVAKLHPQKGHLTFLEAIRRAREIRPHVKGIIVGEGYLRPKLERWVADHQMQANIEFWGFREDLPQVFHELDLFVMSSDWEGLPLALLDAAATGLPFACTAVGGIPEVFQDGVHGRLVPPENPSELANAIVWSLDHYAAACAMARKASELVHERQGLPAMIRRHEALYRQLVQA